jgi:hypothetical protein
LGGKGEKGGKVGCGEKGMRGGRCVAPVGECRVFRAGWVCQSTGATTTKLKLTMMTIMTKMGMGMTGTDLNGTKGLRGLKDPKGTKGVKG